MAYRDAAYDSAAIAHLAAQTYARYLPGLIARLPSLEGTWMSVLEMAQVAESIGAARLHERDRGRAVDCGRCDGPAGRSTS